MAARNVHLALSVPSGFHARELLIPLKELLENDDEINHISCITPGAAAAAEIFPTYGKKFSFFQNPATDTDHQQLLRQIAPDIVITTTSGLDWHDVPILRAAKALKLPTFTFVASWDNVYKMERFKDFGKPYELADHLVVWNQMMFDHVLRAFKLPSAQVSIIGAPRFDFFFHANRIPSREHLFQYLGLPPTPGKLLHIATTELYPMEYIVKSIREAAHTQRLPTPLHLYASVHPGGTMSKHQGYAKKYDVTVKFSFGRRQSSPVPEFLYNPTIEEIYFLVALFKHSDILINHSSTVAIESMVANVPVVNVKYGQPLDWWRWYRSMVYRDFQQHYADIIKGGGTTVVTNRRQLTTAIAAYLNDSTRQQAERHQTAQTMLTTIDGSASQHMLDLIKEKALNHSH